LCFERRRIGVIRGKYENSPLVLLNALASHTSLIALNVKSLAKISETRKDGFTFRRGNIDELESVVRKIIASPEIFRQLCFTTNSPRASVVMAVEPVYFR